MRDEDVDSTSTPSSADSPAPMRSYGMTLQKCQAIIQKSIKKDPTVKFLIESLEKSGCSIGSNFIKAANCDQPASAGFARGYGIRANHLSGNCHYVREILRRHLKLDDLRIKGHEPVCVKRRSMQSVASLHSPAIAKRAVEAVWDTCYNDTAPFDRVP